MAAPIIVSVDPNYSFTKADIECDVWIVSSAANLILADEIRRISGTKSMTVFDDLGSPVENAISMLPSVFEHHPDAVDAKVRGLTDNERRQAIQDAAPEWLGSSVGEEVVFRPSA
ncbi:hypothetical protein RMR16_006835 [Agrobacterium sp. rho-13.3]|uniref:hypothetical protein n=1 Tax=Agrobacterium sp. rho-13.3 TaxID=3072980 RepID=UPI002A0C5223|nr:hypothetical protein [Agrobacterium sp. rho-13.3]MDX8311168.1 hypothetical protein [Agrobacterium sp. rho-13.3]